MLGLHEYTLTLKLLYQSAVTGGREGGREGADAVSVQKMIQGYNVYGSASYVATKA